VVLFLFALSVFAEDDDVVVRQAAETADPNLKNSPQGANVCLECELTGTTSQPGEAKKSAQKLDDFLRPKYNLDLTLTPDEAKAAAHEKMLKEQNDFMNAKEKGDETPKINIKKNGISTGGGVSVKPGRKKIEFLYQSDIKN
jgi:hypothetical protein